ncbi:MAG: toprim domain-containing protein [bacterium]|nr:toprim domain-containing protein [bacterium]
MLPNPIKNFVDAFARLPSIGPRQATRLAFYISNLGKAKIRELAEAIADLANLVTCSRCFRAYTPASGQDPSAGSGQAHSAGSGQVGKGGLCSICSDSTRDKSLIAVIEKETDLLSLEKTRKFNGWYLVLGELSKLGELGPEQKLRLSSLKDFIKKELSGSAEEIIIATNPTAYGDLSAVTLKKELEGNAGKITRLGRGIPTGGEIEFADEDTLGSALDRRL